MGYIRRKMEHALKWLKNFKNQPTASKNLNHIRISGITSNRSDTTGKFL